MFAQSCDAAAFPPLVPPGTREVSEDPNIKVPQGISEHQAPRREVTKILKHLRQPLPSNYVRNNEESKGEIQETRKEV